jgi:hypothetical protein
MLIKHLKTKLLLLKQKSNKKPVKTVIILP